MHTDSPDALLEVVDLQCDLTSAHGTTRAVDGVSFAVARGETLGLVGESGCGKSTLARAIVGLVRPTHGTVSLAGGTRSLSAKQRARIVQIVFQDPFGSLNPRLTIGRIIEEPLIVHRIGSSAERKERVKQLLGDVGLPAEVAKRYPHELSGGQRQRVAIARALALEPQLLVCDEPVSALDVSIQAQILNLLNDLQVKRGLSYIFITHDLSVVRYIADRIAVMYLGKIVEMGTSHAVSFHPQHPYTRMLIQAIPEEVDSLDTNLKLSKSDMTTKSFAPGCRFRARCPLAVPQCEIEEPALTVQEAGHAVACWQATCAEPQLNVPLPDRRAEDHPG